MERPFQSRPKVPMLRLHGPVGMRGPATGGFDFEGVKDAIEKAFKTGGAVAVALIVDSPGGSPVQSRRIHDHVRALAEEKKLPVYVFCEDAAASGGYLIACAGDHIFADESSIIGSIGVISAGFGFPELLSKIGVERRVTTAGDDKSTLDPFLPEKKEDVERLKAIQREVHESFKALVKARRGERLKGEEKDLMNGEFWAARKALEFGLIDGIGHPRDVLRRRFGEKVKLVDTPLKKKGFVSKLLGAFGGGGFSFGARDVPERMAAAMVDAAFAKAESRALWARLGL